MMPAAKNHYSSDGLVLVGASVSNGRIVAEIPIEELRRILAEGNVVILKGVFAPDRMLELRNAVRRWWREIPEYPHGKSPTTTPDVNYHRIDRGNYQSTLPHIFHQAGFNNLSILEDYVSGAARETGELMRELQNTVAETDFDFAVTGLRIKVLHYPSGGGFLTEHAHPRLPQGVGLITSLSRLDVDVKTGGTTFRTPFGLVDTHDTHDIGDVIIFRYDLPHAVTLVDEGNELDWNSDAGKWSFVLDLRETHAQSQAHASQ